MNVVLLFLILAAAVGTLGGPDTTVHNILCNKQSFSDNDVFKDSLADVLSDLATLTSTMDDYDYYSASLKPRGSAYGHATCEGHLNNGDCEMCLWNAMGAVVNGCFQRIGAQVEMVDCCLQYENYSFND